MAGRLLLLAVATATAIHVRHNRHAAPAADTPPDYRTDVATNLACHNATAGYNTTLMPGTYRSSRFFDCFRTQAQINAFLDTLVAQNPGQLAKLQIATSVRQQPIHAYKLCSDKCTTTKPSIYVQSMMHAREWVSGSSNLFALASFLDELHANATPLATKLFDIYFVPVVNVDGYADTWSGTEYGESRYTRTNAHAVDLNRNYPSTAFNHDNDAPGSETYPGLKPLSEPENQGIASFLKAHPMQGFLDIHTFSGLVLYPFGDTTVAPNGTRYTSLASSVASALNDAMGPDAYVAQHSIDLYPCYGTFIDWAYRTYDKPAVTIEVAGDDFVDKTSNIRVHGRAIYAAQNAFAEAAVLFNNSPKRV
ncbi:carboxypeptidase [Achlya hypogyna]|uniref:Carboxypeptidase n=1 Tax=Achlya hypogyna TaxID=1202772 RepID=A0A1V9Y5T0_ACHHY|nr:carboxypeptidase [Achlya hypogyna]